MTKDKLVLKAIEVYERLSNGTLLPTDIVESADAAVESHPSWIANMYKKNRVTESDALVFRHFGRSMGTILDVGAHWGYMALSMRNSGTDCHIISFEASSAHKASLERLKELDGHGFEYRIVGVSDVAKSLSLFCPIVNGSPISALNSVDGAVFGPSHAEYIGTLVGNTIPIADDYVFKLLKTKVKCRPLDELLLAPDIASSTTKIAALKIDVEGHEAQVLQGARRMIERDLPFIMNEGANRSPVVTVFMRQCGYRAAERRGHQITEIFQESSDVNGYWFHNSKRGDYEAMGLIKSFSLGENARRWIKSMSKSRFLNIFRKRKHL